MAGDDDLIRAHLTGDAGAFEALYDRHHRCLLAFLVGLEGDMDQAHDLAQDTWMKALDGLGSYRANGRLRSWLFKIGHRLWIDHRRSAWERRRQPVSPGNAECDSAPWENQPDPCASPRAMAVRLEQKVRLEEAVACLPETLRAALLLRMDGELTHREIAEVMDCPLGTALWRVREAQKRVTELVKEATA